MNALERRLLAELGRVEERPALEAELSKASLERRAALGELGRIERELGPRVWAIHEAMARRARRPRWLARLLDVLGLSPPDPEEPRLRAAEHQVEALDAALARLRAKLESLRDADRRVDELVASWKSESGEPLPPVSLAKLAEAAHRAVLRVFELEEAYEAAARGQWAVSAAAVTLAEAEALAEQQVHFDELDQVRWKKYALVRQASADLGRASAEFARAGATISSSLAGRAQTAVSGTYPDPPLDDSARALVAPLEGASELASSVAEPSARATEDLGRALHEAHATLERLRADRERQLGELRAALNATSSA